MTTNVFAERVIRHGTVGCRYDAVDGGMPATIAVETIHPHDGSTPATIAVVSGALDEVDDTVRHLTCAQAAALAAKLAAAAEALERENDR
jgi:hypothetical protein